VESLSRSLRRAPLRLAIVVLLSLLVAGALYSISLTPVSQSLASTRGGPPAGRGLANPAAAPAASTTTPSASTDPAASAPVTAGSDTTASQPAPMTRPPGGGGRPASLSRGLPELARNVGVIAVLIVMVAGIQAWLRIRRRPQARRSLA
jgi:hypothetical protein